jgi:two-component system, cell cycle sensor histidine kinase and response regulator CckA
VIGSSGPGADQELLEAKIEAVCRLAAGVAHDFNNLLTVISGNVELLQADEQQPGPRRVELEEVADAARRAAALTNQLLAFSRQQLLQPRALQVNALVLEQRDVLQRIAGVRVAFELRLDPATSPVMADESQVAQVLIQLVSNARDAMPRGGALRIATANISLDAIQAAHQAPMVPGEYVVLSVADTGTGMDARTQARAFEPFFTTKAPGNGSGMGLATVYGIVKQSGGFIFCDSVVGHGTVFRVYLPRAEVHVTSPPVRPRAASRPPGPETVLIVEDEPLVRAFARRSLERAGFRVYDAAGGRDGLNAARALGSALNVLLTDIVMPDLNGLDLATAVELELPHVAVVLMSGYASESGARNTSWSFLRKPFTVDELRSHIRAAIAEPISS